MSPKVGTPGPAGWSGVHVGLCLLLVAVVLSLSDACCVEERAPISNCSFSYNQNQDSVLCDMTYFGLRSNGECPYYGIVDVENVPAPVNNDFFTVEVFYTSCAPTIYDFPLKASSCDTRCGDPSRLPYAGLNITFKADEWTAENLEAVDITLRDTIGRIWCQRFELVQHLSKAAAEQHLFYFDGFIGLVPTREYIVSVRTLPTSVNQENVLSRKIEIPKENCWQPDVLVHDTPFAVNLTFFQNNVYNLTKFVVVLRNARLSRHVDFMSDDLYWIDGKLGLNVFFPCREPGTYELVFIAKECSLCAFHFISITVNGTPPSFSNCPSDIFREVELGSMSGQQVQRDINWMVPTPVFHISDCESARRRAVAPIGWNQTHQPMESGFRLDTVTPVTYTAWQYREVVTCTFTVQLKTVDTTPPEILFCPPNIHVAAEPNMKSRLVTWGKPGAVDKSGEVKMIPSIKRGSSFPAGENTTVRYQIIDAYNNSALDCVFYVYVEATPVASPLVIGASVTAGILLILVVAVIVYKNRRPTDHDVRRLPIDHREAFHTVPDSKVLQPVHNCTFGDASQGIDLSLLYSEFSIDKSIKKQKDQIKAYQAPNSERLPNRSSSQPDMTLLTSGYESREFRTSFGPPREGGDMREAEDVWTSRSDGGGDGAYSDMSQYSGSYDDSPVSLESVC